MDLQLLLFVILFGMNILINCHQSRIISTTNGYRQQCNIATLFLHVRHVENIENIYFEYSNFFLIVLIAFNIPYLDLIISLTGSVCISSLAFIYPAIFEIATFWNSSNMHEKKILKLRTFFLIVFGLMAACFGTYKSIVDIIKK